MTKPLFFLHVPKTAGTSVNDFLASNYPRNAQHVELHQQWREPAFWSQYQFVSGHINFDDAAKVVPKGTVWATFLRDPWRQLLSTLRYQYAIEAPESRHLFHYVGDRLRNLSKNMHAINIEDPKEFEAWLAASGDMENRMFDNFQTRFLTKVKDEAKVTSDDLSAAQRNLHTIDAVGVVENMNDSIKILSKVIGLGDATLPPVKTLNQKLVDLPGLDSEDIKEICAPWMRHDLDLYSFGKRLLSDRIRYLEHGQSA